NMGALSGAFGGSMSWANAAGSIYANTTGTGISGLLATNGAYGTAGGAGLAGSAAAGIAAIAAPLIIGSIIESNSRDRISGAAYATSGGNDPFVNTVAGSASFNYLTGDLPDRAALLARLEELGAPMEAISDWNDRALLRLMESAAADDSEFGINWTSRVRDMRDTPDFYRGAGYAHPQAMGWWNNKGNANLSTDPALIQASRDIALSIVEPLKGIGALIGDEAVYRATVGFANRGEGKGVWAGFDLQRDGQSIADWVNKDDFHSVGEAMRAMYSSALGSLESFDLPGWADKQVTDARTALDALSGDKIGEEAAALYAQATAGIEQMYRSIQMLIDVFPDFSAATQDNVHALAQLMGGMDQLQGAYSSYLQNFWSDEERAALMRKQLSLELEQVGLSLPETRDAFRDLVEAQDLSTEAGREAFAALMRVNAAFAEVYGNADAAAGSIAGLGDELAAMEPIVFGAASDLASVIEQGLLGTLTGAQLGEQMADVVMQGMYSAIAGGFSQQITALMVDGVLNPMIAAAMTGASMSDAVSQAAIDRVIQHAQAAAAAINAVLSDPGFQAAIQQVQAAVGSISVGIQRPEPIYDSYAAQNARALAAQREAERMAQQAAQEAQRAADEEARRQQGIMNERLGLTKQL
ncbi:MAG TPA: hypothetical protein PLG53_17035, partial [Accumulibacter sp.]|nr:hypothetical protein [Accumulibacter sp.]